VKLSRGEDEEGKENKAAGRKMALVYWKPTLVQ
jgi:hypothetical protein